MTLWKDLRYAARVLLKNPLFAAVAILSVALGIGANTAIFSLIDAVLLKMLPVKNPEQLLVLGSRSSKATGYSFTYPTYRRLQDQDQSFTGLAAFSPVRLNVSIDGAREPVAAGQLVSGNYYTVLGVNAILGRTLSPGDDLVPSGHPVAMLSYGYWKRRFALDPAVVGKQVFIDGAPFTIVGVTPPEFFGLEVGASPDISLPIMMQPVVMPETESWLVERTMVSSWLRIFGRLKPGVDERQALAKISVVYQEITQDYAAKFSGKPAAAKMWLQQKLVFTPGGTGLSALRAQFSKPLLILMTVVGLVLLIACGNLANLLLARAASRQREMAVRVAVGARRTRLVRQLLTESVLLTMVGGILGLLFARWGSDLLVKWMSIGQTPIILDLHPDYRVLGFTVAVSILTGILVGLAPALRITRVELSSALKDEARNPGGQAAGRSLMLGKILVISQVAMSLLLLIGAGLFVRSLQKLNTIDTGFTRENVLLLRLEPRGSDQKHANIRRLMTIYADLLDRIESIPGVRSASLAGFSPLHHSGFGGPISVPGFTPQSQDEMNIRMTAVYPKYFATVGIPILLGRDFGPAETSPQAPMVAVINQTMAKHFFPHDNPVGRQFFERATAVEIIGVVKDAKYNSLREPTPSLAYLPFLQTPTGRGQMTLHVRARGDPSGIIARIRQEALTIDKDMPVFEVQTLASEVDSSIAQERLVARLSSFFGMLALLLASIGLYGVLAYAAARRTGEIGIRMALGAQPGDVVWLVMREVLLLIGIGVSLGLAVATAATRLVASLLFGLTPTDPLTIGIATLLMVTVALLAGYLPARKASRIDPMLALRHE